MEAERVRKEEEEKLKRKLGAKKAKQEAERRAKVNRKNNMLVVQLKERGGGLCKRQNS